MEQKDSSTSGTATNGSVSKDTTSQPSLDQAVKVDQKAASPSSQEPETAQPSAESKETPARKKSKGKKGRKGRGGKAKKAKKKEDYRNNYAKVLAHYKEYLKKHPYYNKKYSEIQAAKEAAAFASLPPYLQNQPKKTKYIENLEEVVMTLEPGAFPDDWDLDMLECLDNLIDSEERAVLDAGGYDEGWSWENDLNLPPEKEIQLANLLSASTLPYAKVYTARRALAFQEYKRRQREEAARRKAAAKHAAKMRALAKNPPPPSYGYGPFETSLVKLVPSIFDDTSEESRAVRCRRLRMELDKDEYADDDEFMHTDNADKMSIEEAEKLALSATGDLNSFRKNKSGNKIGFITGGNEPKLTPEEEREQLEYEKLMLTWNDHHYTNVYYDNAPMIVVPLERKHAFRDLKHSSELGQPYLVMHCAKELSAKKDTKIYRCLDFAHDPYPSKVERMIILNRTQVEPPVDPYYNNLYIDSGSAAVYMSVLLPHELCAPVPPQSRGEAKLDLARLNLGSYLEQDYSVATEVQPEFDSTQIKEQLRKLFTGMSPHMQTMDDFRKVCLLCTRHLPCALDYVSERLFYKACKFVANDNQHFLVSVCFNPQGIISKVYSKQTSYIAQSCVKALKVLVGFTVSYKFGAFDGTTTTSSTEGVNFKIYNDGDVYAFAKGEPLRRPQPRPQQPAQAQPQAQPQVLVPSSAPAAAAAAASQDRMAAVTQTAQFAQTAQSAQSAKTSQSGLSGQSGVAAPNGAGAVTATAEASAAAAQNPQQALAKALQEANTLVQTQEQLDSIVANFLAASQQAQAAQDTPAEAGQGAKGAVHQAPSSTSPVKDTGKHQGGSFSELASLQSRTVDEKPADTGDAAAHAGEETAAPEFDDLSLLLQPQRPYLKDQHTKWPTFGRSVVSQNPKHHPRISGDSVAFVDALQAIVKAQQMTLLQVVDRKLQKQCLVLDRFGAYVKLNVHFKLTGEIAKVVCKEQIHLQTAVAEILIGRTLVADSDGFCMLQPFSLENDI